MSEHEPPPSETGADAATARAERPTPSPDPRELLRRLHEYRSRRDWEAVIAVGRKLPATLDSHDWCDVADAVAFGLGQRGRHLEAIELLERVVQVAPTPARYSSLAYLHYDAALRLAVRRPAGKTREGGGGKGERAGRRDDAPQPTGAELQRLRELHRKGFRRWIAEALRARPDSVKDLYRLGIFEAQVENQHDKPALRAFLAAIRAYRGLDETTRARRGDLRKAHAKALYAGARSALRLGRLDLARKMSFALVREDREHDDVEPLFKMALAGRVCLRTGELDAADRAFRIALDAKGPPERAWLHAYIAQTYLARNDPRGGAAWLDRHVPARKRMSAVWRLRGDLARAAGEPDVALRCYEAALEKDRMGRHLTLVRMGELHEQAGRHKAAEQAYRSANEVRRRVHGSEDARALAGLARVLGLRGKNDEAQSVRRRLADLAKTRPRFGAAESEAFFGAEPEESVG
jgi:tetratricopeptide (TPR) repeat protein